MKAFPPSLLGFVVHRAIILRRHTTVSTVRHTPVALQAVISIPGTLAPILQLLMSP